MTATAPSSSQINLSWTAATDNVDVTGYYIERCQGAGCTLFFRIALASGTIYSDIGLAASTTHLYRVRATDGAGNLGPYTSIVSATTLAAGSANFALSASPASSTVVPGNQGTSAITSTLSNGFNASVALSALGMPSGTTVSFNPSTIAAPNGGNSTMTVTVGSGTALGTYPITVTGIGAGIQQTTTVTLNVVTSFIRYVQGNYADPQSSPTTVNVTYTAAQTAGNLNVVVVGWNDGPATVSSVTDTAGDMYTRAVGPTVISGVEPESIYCAKNIAAAAAGANVVTITFSGPAAFPDIRVLEYGGADPVNSVDVTAASSGNSSNSTSGLVTTTNANDLLFGANLVQSTTNGPGSVFTSRLLTVRDGDIVEDEFVTAI